MLSKRVDAALALLRAEYLETPNLFLTAGEAAELLDLTRTQAVAVLQVLEDSGFLKLTPAGRFVRSPDRLRSSPRCIVDSKNKRGLSACIQPVRMNFMTLDWMCL